VAVKFTLDAEAKPDQQRDEYADADVELAGEWQVSAPAAVAARLVLASGLVRQLG